MRERIVGEDFRQFFQGSGPYLMEKAVVDGQNSAVTTSAGG